MKDKNPLNRWFFRLLRSGKHATMEGAAELCILNFQCWKALIENGFATSAPDSIEAGYWTPDGKPVLIYSMELVDAPSNTIH